MNGFRQGLSPAVPELEPSFHGFTEADLEKPFQADLEFCKFCCDFCQLKDHLGSPFHTLEFAFQEANVLTSRELWCLKSEFFDLCCCLDMDWMLKLKIQLCLDIKTSGMSLSTSARGQFGWLEWRAYVARNLPYLGLSFLIIIHECILLVLELLFQEVQQACTIELGFGSQEMLKLFKRPFHSQMISESSAQSANRNPRTLAANPNLPQPRRFCRLFAARCFG